MSDEMIYCQWIDMIVNSKLLGKYCSIHFFNGRCTRCLLSPQLKYGKTPKELLKQLQRSDM